MTYFLWNVQTNCYIHKGTISWRSIKHFDAIREADKGWDYEGAKRALNQFSSMKTIIIVNNRELLRKYINLVMKS